MKKIIYSLVIMIAAGSLFTSCIEQVEPLGIQDLRYAKAEYIRALKDLRAADAEYRRAEAAVQLAIARYEDALTAGVNADTEYQKLLNEYQALVNQDYAGEVAYNEAERLAKLDSLQKAMEVRELNHKRELAEAEKDMRIAQEDLRVTIRNISLAAGDLTANEKVAIYEAAAVYYYLLEQVIVQDSVVNAAQIELDKAQEYALRFSDTAWCPGKLELVNVYEQIEHEIAIEQAKIAFWMDKYENLPDTSAAVAEWKEYMDGFDDAIDEINVKKAEIVADKTAYEAMIKEGIRDFDIAIAEWIEENWDTKDGVKYIQPATSAGKKPTEADYTSKVADSLKIVMIKPEDPKAAAAWAKFVYLLTSYKDDNFPGSKATPANKVITVNGTEDTVTVIVRQDMKEFILGAAGNEEESQKYEYTDKDKNKHTLKADYGLLGVYDILARDKVIGENAKPSEKQIADAKKAMDNAEKAWVKDSTILHDGIDKFAPLANGEEDLIDQIAINGMGAQGMVNAVIDLQKAFKATGTLIKSFDGNDSTKLFNALVEFAINRENYLDFSSSVEEIDPQDPAKRDSSIFYYSQGKSGAGKPIFASVPFSELDEDDLNAGEYEYTTANPGDVKFVTGDPDSTVNAFANILDQLAPELGVIFDFANDTVDFSKYVPGTNILTTGLYGKYKLDSWDNPKKILNLDGSPYEPQDLKDAKENFVDSINAFVAAYRAFWGKTKTEVPDFAVTDTPVKNYIDALANPDATAKQISDARKALVNAIKTRCPNDPLNVDSYSRRTFVPYADQYPIVYFQGGAIIPTAALSAVLNSVDPKAKGKGDNYMVGKVVENETAIFNAGATDFFKYMKAASNYYDLVNAKASENLKLIRAEIQKVEDALKADEEQAGKLDEKAYKAALDKWEVADALAQAYFEAKMEFVGVYDVDAKGNPILNDVFAVVNPDLKAGRDTAVQGKTAWLKANGLESLFAVNIIGHYSGWREDLAGEQLEIAEELFGEEPWEQYNEWELELAQYTEQINELNKLKLKAEDVYMAKAKVEGYRDAGTSGATATDIEGLYKAYKDAYEALQRDLVVFDEFGNIDPENNTAKINKAYNKIDRLAHQAATYKSDKPDYDHQINYLQHELEKEQNRLKTLKDGLKLAKENYDRIREYLLSQDGVSYVIPVSTADIDDAIMNIEYLLRSLGHTFADVYTEVGDKIGI